MEKITVAVSWPIETNGVQKVEDLEMSPCVLTFVKSGGHWQARGTAHSGALWLSRKYEDPIDALREFFYSLRYAK